MASQVFWKGFSTVFNPVFFKDMTIQKNIANQNVTFALINSSTDAPLTGATITAWISKDGLAQVSVANSFTELTPTGNGIYNYPFTQAETNGNCVSLFVTATNGLPENMMFLTGGLHRNLVGQHVTFELYTTGGVADAGATVTVNVSKDGGSLVAGGGTVTNLGHGQYDYAPTASETNSNLISTFVFSAAGDVTQSVAIFVVP